MSLVARLKPERSRLGSRVNRRLRRALCGTLKHLSTRRRSRRRSQPAAAEGHFVTCSKTILLKFTIGVLRRQHQATHSNVPQYIKGRRPFKKGTKELQPSRAACLNLFANCYSRVGFLLREKQGLMIVPPTPVIRARETMYLTDGILSIIEPLGCLD
jgi:hypothetical protein